jgi:hypothetical protein
MPTWFELHSMLQVDQQAEVELMAMMWRQAAERADAVLNSNLCCNQWNVQGMCIQLQYAGVAPDAVTLEWAKARDGYPAPVPFWVNR